MPDVRKPLSSVPTPSEACENFDLEPRVPDPHQEKDMNKADLTEKLAQRAGIPKVRAAAYINILTEAVQESLVNEEKVTISDFGTFTVSKRRAFTGHNPKNGQVMAVPQRRIPVFRAGKGLKNSLNPN
jgi:nucleoid DNA-binding protein